jgi:hypothetical protein
MALPQHLGLDPTLASLKEFLPHLFNWSYSLLLWPISFFLGPMGNEVDLTPAQVYCLSLKRGKHYLVYHPGGVIVTFQVLLNIQVGRGSKESQLLPVSACRGAVGWGGREPQRAMAGSSNLDDLPVCLALLLCNMMGLNLTSEGEVSEIIIVVISLRNVNFRKL